MTIITYPAQVTSLIGEGVIDLGNILPDSDKNAVKLQYFIPNISQVPDIDVTWRIPRIYRAGTIQLAQSSSPNLSFPTWNQFLEHQSGVIGWCFFNTQVPLFLDFGQSREQRGAINGNTEPESGVIGITSGVVNGVEGGTVAGIPPAQTYTGGYQSTVVALDGSMAIPPFDIDGGLTLFDGWAGVPTLVADFLSSNRGESQFLHYKIPNGIAVLLLIAPVLFANNDDIV